MKMNKYNVRLDQDMTFVSKEKFFLDIQNFVKKHQGKYFVCVSGGPDSIFLFLCLYSIFCQQNRKEDLIVLHYHHRQRAQSDQEEKYVQEMCALLGIKFIGAHYLSLSVLRNKRKKTTENTLRKARIIFFESCIYHYQLNKKTPIYLCTGHHLDDRIETVFLNLRRGTHINGLFPLKSLVKKQRFTKNLQKIDYTIFRPLTTIPKKHIIQKLTDAGIQYFYDISNENTNVSQRNRVRHTLSDCKGPEIYDFFKEFFAKHPVLEEILGFEKLMCPWNPHTYILVCKQDKIKYVSHLVYILDYLGVYRGVSSSFLQHMYEFTSSHTSGEKYFGGRNFCVCHGYLYMIKGERKVWEKKRGVSSSICIKEFKKMLVVYPGKDISMYTRKRKKLAKWYINQKIPFFIRPYLPVGLQREELVCVCSHDDLRKQGFVVG